MKRFDPAKMILLLAALGWFGAHGCSRKDGTPTADKTPAPSVLRVTTVRPQRKTIRRSVTQPAQIEAFEQARLYAKVPAYVQEYRVDIGDVVERGRLLAVLSAPELVHDLDHKRALVAQAAAEYEQAQASIKIAEAEVASAEAVVGEALAGIDRYEAEAQRWNSEFDRITQLVSRSAATQKLADETKNQMLAARAARKQAEATIERARSQRSASLARVEKARADEVAASARRDVAKAEEAKAASVADYLKIQAPFDGTIAERHADIGLFAQPPGSPQALPLFTLVRTDQVRAFADLPEMDAPLVDRGDEAWLHVEALAGQEFRGSVTRTSWTLDPHTRTLRVEIDVPNPKGQLRPGMYARVKLDLAVRENACVVPLATISSQGTPPSVFVAVDGKAKRKSIVPGIRSGDEVEIVSGVDEQDTVIVAKGASLSDGQAVEPVQPTPAK